MSTSIPRPKKGIVKRGAWEITKKLLKAIPIVGPVFVVGFAGRDIHKKGLVPGAVHVGLDVTPVVGTVKNVVEIFTGDLIPDKGPTPPRAASIEAQERTKTSFDLSVNKATPKGS